MGLVEEIQAKKRTVRWFSDLACKFVEIILIEGKK